MSEIEKYLRNIPEVNGITDNLPYSQEQLIFKVNETGKNLGLSTNDIGRQLRAAFNSEILQTFNDPNEEIVTTAIPLGLIGAMLGHWFMGLDVTLLSLFGLFGLSGIVIND